MRPRGSWAGLLLALGLVAWPPSASALTQRGHEYSKSFSIPAEAELLEPAGVAINESSGDVYVADLGHNRVERFSAKGAFISDWGWGVSGGSAYAVCAAGEKCKPGAEKKPEPDAFDAPEAIAVDNSREAEDPSKGDVYVVNSKGKPIVDKFSPTGEFLGTLFSKAEANEFAEEEYEGIQGIGVDTHGVLWIAFQAEAQTDAIRHYSDATVNERVVEPEAELRLEGRDFARPGFAVNAEDDFYLDVETGGEEETRHPCSVARCAFLRISSNGEDEYLPELGETFAEGLFGSSETSIAVDLATDGIYVGHPSFVSAFGSNQSFVQTFGEGHLIRTGGIGVNGVSQNVYVSDAATGALELYVPEQQMALPQIDGLSAHAITTSSAEAIAQIDPRGSETTVTFEYGTAPCSGGGCAAVSATAIPAGFGDVQSAASLPALAPGSTYYVRVLVENATGEASSEATFTTRPIPLEDSRAWELVSSADAKGAGYESASKEGGLTQASEDGSALTYLSTAPTESGAQGNRSPYFTQNLARRTVSPTTGKPEWTSQDISIPAPDRTPGVATGSEQEYFAFSTDLSFAVIQPYGLGVLAEPPLSAPVTSGEEQEKTLYLRHNEGTCYPVPSSCYEALVTAANDHGEVEGERSRFGGTLGVKDSGLTAGAASSDAQHVVFSSGINAPSAPLTTGASSEGENLYEWNRDEPESLQLVGLLPPLTPGEERPAQESAAGTGLITRDAVSEDGTHVYFKSGNDNLYLRDTASGETLQIDSPLGEEIRGKATYQGASANGKRVFFLDERPLVAESHAEEERPDLYEWEQTSEEEEPLAGKLTDLSLPLEAEPANVKGVVPAISKDGTTVYFVADGVLAGNVNAEGEAAAHGGCEYEAPATTCNLYLSKLNAGAWSTTFIAKLSGVDAPDFGRKNANQLQAVVSGASPDGQYYAFDSERPLRRDYDNRVLTPEGHGARAEEVYLYNAATESLTCVSCEPDGKRPLGVPDIAESGEGLGLLVDRPEEWSNVEGETDPVWLAGNLPGWSSDSAYGYGAQQPPHYLTDAGRLFFNSPEPLVPADENGKNDVYEYEQDGGGSCASVSGCVSLISSGTSTQESAFLEASGTGDDVFFLTGASLVSNDVNGAADVYDARVCSAESPCVEPPGASASPCESRPGCDGTPATSVPAISAAPTTATGPSGNLGAPNTVLPPKTAKPIAKPLTRAQRLAKALKSCRRDKKKSKRKLCEKQARKKYGTHKKKK